jgi:hypothetical protein
MWIRIRIYVAVLDPGHYWECGFGSRSMKIDKNLHITLVVCLSKRPFYLRRHVFGLSPTVSIFFNEKIQIFVTRIRILNRIRMDLY